MEKRENVGGEGKTMKSNNAVESCGKRQFAYDNAKFRLVLPRKPFNKILNDSRASEDRGNTIK